MDQKVMEAPARVLGPDDGQLGVFATIAGYDRLRSSETYLQRGM